jgi:CRISPR system Cascade subunit CasA
VVDSLGIWSGGLRVSSNAGEQYVAGMDDYVESEVRLEASWLGDLWFSQLKAEMEVLDEIAKKCAYGSVLAYYGTLKMDGKKHAAQASNLFWQLAERKFQDLVDACADESGAAVAALRRTFVGYANRAYDTFAPRETARQLEAWAAHRPNLGKFLATAE